MQDRYSGDIGDFVKLALLRTLSVGKRLGVAWYLHPDEGGNNDGRHVAYLEDSKKWRGIDSELFDALKMMVDGNKRSIASIIASGVIPAQSHTVRMVPPQDWRERATWRENWFLELVRRMDGADLVFADPDNGLVDDERRRLGKKTHCKSITLSEARMLAEGRTAIIYHHNTRRKGGHDVEVDYWLDQLALPAFAIRATMYSCRTFFVLNPTQELQHRAQQFCQRWPENKVRVHSNLN